MGVAACTTTEDEERWTESMATASTTRMEKKEDEEGRVKKFPFSKPKGVVFLSPNQRVVGKMKTYSFRKKENDHRLRGEEAE